MLRFIELSGCNLKFFVTGGERLDSRPVLVNRDQVQELQPVFYWDYAVLMADGTRLTLSRNFRNRVEKMFGGAQDRG